MLISAVICFAVMTLIASQRVGRAVLIPLRELKRAAEQVAEGDLDDRIAYEGRDEFEEVCLALDDMRFKLKESGEKIAQYEEQRKEMLAGISEFGRR